MNAPEIHSLVAEEKAAGLASKNALEKHLSEKENLVRLIISKVEKFGRSLSLVYRGGEENTVNDWLLKNSYAVSYEGGARDLKCPECLRELTDGF